MKSRTYVCSGIIARKYIWHWMIINCKNLKLFQDEDYVFHQNSQYNDQNIGPGVRRTFWNDLEFHNQSFVTRLGSPMGSYECLFKRAYQKRLNHSLNGASKNDGSSIWTSFKRRLISISSHRVLVCVAKWKSASCTVQIPIRIRH